MTGAAAPAAQERAGRIKARALAGAVSLATAAGTALVLGTGPALAAGTPSTTGGGLPSTSGGGAAPPGVSTNVDTIFSWASWVVFTIAIAGVLFVAVKMILEHHRGEGGRHMASLFYVLAGAILCAAASGIIGVLTSAS
jgi:hypothetical protein